LAVLGHESGSSLEALQALVGEPIECVRIVPGFDAWIIEQGRILGVPHNRWSLVGPIVITRTDAEVRTHSLDDLDVHRLRELIRRCP
jgi:hypothetical protein